MYREKRNMMSRKLKVMIAMLSGLVLILSLSGCGSSSASNTTNKVKISKVGTVKKSAKLHKLLPSRIKESGVIKNGIDDSYPPMDFKNDSNELTGFDIDVGKAIGAKLGVEVKNVPTDWAGIIPSLKSKKFDMVLSAMGITKERANSVSFSKPYFNGGMTIIMNKKDKGDIKGASDLKGKVVGVQAGSQACIDYVEKIGGVKEIKKYDSATEALQDLGNNRTNAYVDDFQVANYYMKKVPGTYARVMLKVDEPYGIAFRKNDGQMQKSVQAAFDELKKDGTLSKISKKWFDYDIYKNN